LSETPVEIEVSKEKAERSRFQKFKDFVTNKSPTSRDESDRFERLGYLKYPMRDQLDFRLFALKNALKGIEGQYAEVYKKRLALIDKLEKAKTDEQKTHLKEIIKFTEDVTMRDLKRKAIDKLGDTFELMGGPWYKGLDKPRLGKKMLAYQKVLSCYGEVPAIHKVLKYGTHVLLNFSWAREDVEPETPVLMETRTSIQTQGGGAPSAKTDSMGTQMLIREIRELRQKIADIEKEKGQ